MNLRSTFHHNFSFKTSCFIFSSFFLFRINPVKKFVEWIFNFDILDLDIGLFAFGARGVYSSLRLGTVRFLDNHEMKMYYD